MNNLSSRCGARLRRLAAFLGAGLGLVVAAPAAPVRFDIPAQPAAPALVAFATQSGHDVLFSAAELRQVRANEVKGEFEPEAALGRLLAGTGFAGRRDAAGKFIVAPVAPGGGSISGSLTGLDGRTIRAVRIALAENAGITGLAGAAGDYVLTDVPAGTYTVVATAPGYQPLHITGVRVRPGRDVVLGRHRLHVAADSADITTMAPYVVHADSTDVTELDPFEVTDRRVQPFSDRNVDLPRTVNDPQPYFIFTSREIDRSGVLNLEQFFKRTVPMFVGSTSSDQRFFVGGAIPDVNLRGLGINQTLVLINGRRAAGGNLALNGGGTTNFNFNGIPMAAVERVEILPTTASAIYGASAVGGVINIVLKRTFAGGEIRASYQTPDDTDAPIRKVDLSYGLALEGGRTQITLSGGYSDQALLQSRDRSDMMVGYALRRRNNTIADTGNPAVAWLGATPNILNSVTTVPLTLKPAFGGGSIGAAVTFVPYGVTPTTSPADLGALLRANAGRVNLDPPDTDQLINGQRSDIGTSPRLRSFMMTARREMTENFELNAEFSYVSDKAVRDMATLSSVPVPATSPVNPFTSTVNVNLPFNTTPLTRSYNASRRWTTGFVWRLPGALTLQADYTRTAARNRYWAPPGLFAALDLAAALNAGTFNPFVDTTRFPVNYEQFIAVNAWDGLNTMNDFTARAAGRIWDLPGGEVTLAVGAGRRQDGLKDGVQTTSYPSFPSRNTATQALGKKSVTRHTYLELLVPIVSRSNRRPLVEELNVQLAGRLEDFVVATGTASIPLLPVPATPPTIGSNTAEYRSTNPTLGFSYRPLRSVMLRGSFSEGFVPPTYANLAAPTQAVNPSIVVDPRRGNTSGSVVAFTGGNPDLQPETSQSWNFGLVFEPTAAWAKGLRLSADWVLIEKQNNISTLGAQLMVDNEAAFPGRVARGPVPVGDPFGVGPITSVNLSSVNLLRAFYESVDLSLRYRMPTEAWGVFDFSAIGTIGLQQNRKAALTSPFIDSVGFVGSMLRHNGNANLVWDYKRWTVGWSGRYIPRTKVPQPPTTPLFNFVGQQGATHVAFQHYHDVFVTYRLPAVGRTSATGAWGSMRGFTARLLSGAELQFSVNNVFKHVPPFDVSSSGSFVYSTYGDIRLRDLRVSVRKPF